MITKIRIKNFRLIREQTIDFSSCVVIVGPNNGGKSTLLQALSLFSTAIKSWGEQRLGKQSKAQKRTGVAITLDSVLNIPIATFKELWTDLSVREGGRNEHCRQFHCRE